LEVVAAIGIRRTTSALHGHPAAPTTSAPVTSDPVAPASEAPSAGDTTS
jgi:hypothetical protein